MNQAVCVAAYDLHAGRTVRPLPRNVPNWPNVEYTSGRITVGTVLGVVPADPQPVSAYPHASDDLRLTGNPVRLGVLTRGEVVDALRPTADRTVSTIFDGNLRAESYVEEFVQCRSLGAVMVLAAQIHPFVRQRYSQLRVTFTDASRTPYDLAVTDMEVRQVQEAQGVDAAAQYLQDKLAPHQHAELMLRLGLTRAWSGSSGTWQPRRCTLQCNGLLCP
jgi:hypothetical protein